MHVPDLPYAVQHALKELEARNVSELVLDLRNNRGGLVTGGIEIARMFLPGAPPPLLPCLSSLLHINDKGVSTQHCITMRYHRHDKASRMQDPAVKGRRSGQDSSTLACGNLLALTGRGP